MGQPGDKISVIGKQDQSFAVLVQSSGGNQPRLLRLRDQIDRFFGRMTILQRADISAGFVQHDIEFFRRRCDRAAVKTDPISGPDAHSAAIRLDCVDRDPSCRDQGFGSTPGTYAGCAQIFSKTDFVCFHVVTTSFPLFVS